MSFHSFRSFNQAPASSARIEVDGSVLLYYSSYDPGLVAALKSTVPASDRKWDAARKAWQIAPAHAQTLVELTQRHLGISIQAPATRGVTATRETRILDVRYIGATKDRGNSERSSFGYVAGEWSVIFPEAALKRWFAVETKPGDEATLYNVLGIKASANGSEIRSAYRRLARQWHPDVSDEPDAHEQFIRIQYAYEVLNDPRSRGRYDAGLTLAASIRVALHQQSSFDQVSIGYRPPLRCGLIMVTGIEQLGRFIVDDILAWGDVTNADGQTLVASWPAGANQPTERWV